MHPELAMTDDVVLAALATVELEPTPARAPMPVDHPLALPINITSVYWPLLVQLLKRAGLEVASKSLPALLAYLEAWTPTNVFARFLKPALIAAVGAMIDNLDLAEQFFGGV
jgi:hypothetical protein